MSASRAVARGACSRFSFARFDQRARGSLARLGSGRLLQAICAASAGLHRRPEFLAGTHPRRHVQQQPLVGRYAQPQSGPHLRTIRRGRAARVGATSFEPGAVDKARAVADDIVAELKS